LGDLQKKESSESSNLAQLEAELRRLKTRLVDEQDRAADAESERRRAEVEIAKFRDEARNLSEELERAKTEATQHIPVYCRVTCIIGKNSHDMNV